MGTGHRSALLSTVPHSSETVRQQNSSVRRSLTCHSVHTVSPPFLAWQSTPEPAGWGGTGNPRVARGAPALSGTACLPPSGLLKSLKDSQKLERDLEDLLDPIPILIGRLKPPAGMASARPGLEMAWLALGKEPRLWRPEAPGEQQGQWG